MDYISKHHHTIRNQPFAGLYGTTVILAEPESEARAFYSKQLSDLDMRVMAYDGLPALGNHMQSVTDENSPDVIIVNPSSDIDASINFLKAFRRQFPDLPVITMSLTMPDDTIDAIMSTGVSLHINRGLTRPRDLLLALEQVLSMK